MKDTTQNGTFERKGGYPSGSKPLSEMPKIPQALQATPKPSASTGSQSGQR